MEQIVNQNNISQPHFVNPQQFKKGGGIDRKYLIIGAVLLLVLVVLVVLLTQLKGRDIWNKRTSVFKDLGNDGKDEVARNVVNPLTGVRYTDEESKDWKNLRPLGVMINNHPDARPSVGLADADLTYEVVAEGGITRFLAFYQSVLPEKVGPIRSTREYYLVLAKEVGDAMLMHYGYSPQARVAIDNWPVRSLQIGGIEEGYCPGCIWRDQARVERVAWEHTLFGNAKKMIERGLKLGWEGTDETFYVWQFKDDASAYSSMPSAHKISYDFWYPGDFSAMWQYDPSTNSYSRFMGFDSSNKELPHIDEGANKQITASNIIVQFATETRIAGDEKNRLDYTLIGSGKGFVFLDGRAVEVTWSKAGRDARTRYYDLNGAEIKFNRGKFWSVILPDRSPENLKFSPAESGPAVQNSN